MQESFKTDQILIEGVVSIAKKNGSDALEINKPISVTATSTDDSHLVTLATVKSLISAREFQDSVKAGVFAPPESPSEGDRYIIGNTTPYGIATVSGGHPGIIFLDASFGDVSGNFTNGDVITVSGLTNTSGNGVYTVEAAVFEITQTRINLVQDLLIDESDSPGIVVKGDQGIFAGHINDIAEYSGGAWEFWNPAQGTVTTIDGDTDHFYIFNGTTWVQMGSGSSGASTIGADGSQVKFGTATFDNAASAAVSFPTSFSDASYSVKLTPGTNTSVWFTNKTVGGFTINAASAITGSVDWEVTHS